MLPALGTSLVELIMVEGGSPRSRAMRWEVGGKGLQKERVEETGVGVRTTLRGGPEARREQSRGDGGVGGDTCEIVGGLGPRG